MKLYIVLSGTFDENIEIITPSLKLAKDYCQMTKRLVDLREYDLDMRYFKRPE